MVLGVGVLVPLSCGGPATSYSPRAPSSLRAADAHATWTSARQVLETRCVVCHGCYDAPCQLKLGTYEGIDRGASEAVVYDGTRLTATAPTRLDVDAHDALGWRYKGFHPVLPEGKQTEPAQSVLVRMLDLKRAHPVLAAADIASGYTLELNRKQTCTDAAHFDEYAKTHPNWGMPYALPGLDAKAEHALTSWVDAGSPHDEPAPLSHAVEASITSWEQFLNAPALKSQLAARYIFEHLFLASIYFTGLGNAEDQLFFRLVRSTTLMGPAEEIATRRPFDDPKVSRVYYRFVQRLERPLDKTHMPYPLSPARLQTMHALFIEPKYPVDKLPGYDPQVSANPFRAFQAIPAESRYRFMLDEAEFTLMGFIKGPVCRGQIALDVIEDRFWITFANPSVPWMREETEFLAGEKQDLDLPAESGSNAGPSPLWLRYGKVHERYVDKKNEFMTRAFAAQPGTPQGPALDTIWNGDGKNTNAALTVFRHKDSATVVKGFVGGPPKTAWVIDYPLLERIHYLLVAGFDVFGNVGHQLSTRLYMDFLRMEGEANFLMLLPTSRRQALVESWYRGTHGGAKARVNHVLTSFAGESPIHYRTPTPEQELFALLGEHVHAVAAEQFDLARVEDRSVRASLERLAGVRGPAASWLPELSFVTVLPHVHFTIARESAHSNVMYLLNEDARRVKEEDQLSVMPGFLGAYPNALFQLNPTELDAFVDEITRLSSDASYHALRGRFGVLRSSADFWTLSDRIQEDHHKAVPIAGGLFDYNRLEAY